MLEVLFGEGLELFPMGGGYNKPGKGYNKPMPLKLLVNLLANTANAFDDSGSAFERMIENSQTVQVMKKAGRGGKRGHRLR